MDKSLIASSVITIEAKPKKIWDVLTHPEKIKIYLFGTHVQTDWKEGSPILFQGEYQGQQYIDKGVVIEHKPEKFLKYNYWSGFSGLEDKPENYAVVSYKIEMLRDANCNLTWHQQGFSSEEGKCHTEQGLESMLKKIKELAEE